MPLTYVDEKNRAEADEVIRLVVQGQMSPRAAEMALSSMNAEYDQSKSFSCAASNPEWVLPTAVFYLAWRDLATVIAQLQRFHRWTYALWQDPPSSDQSLSLNDAELVLKDRLRIGMVRSFGTNAEGSCVTIQNEEWDDLCFYKPPRFDQNQWGAMTSKGSLKYCEVTVLRHEMLSLFPSFDNENAAADRLQGKEISASKPTTKINNAGRPLKYDWASASAFIVSFVVENDYPEHESELAQRLIDWFAESGRVPDRRDVERFVSAVYRSAGR